MARGGTRPVGPRLRFLLLNAGIGVSAVLTLAFVISVVYQVVVDDGNTEPAGAAPTPTAATVAAEVTQIEVLNGCGVRGAANMAASILRTGEGFDVVTIGNSDDARIGRSVVLDRVGDPARAGRVAAALGVEEVLFQRAADNRHEVTVIVGYDRGRWDAPFGDR